jgi:hypothetical protein
MQHTDTFPPTDTQDLAELARRIREAHAASRQASLTALDSALAAGDALIAAQAKISAKNWRAWLQENCFLGVSTAFLYQQFARHRAEIETELERVPYLSLCGARKLIAKPKGETKKKTAQGSPTLQDHWKRASDVERTALLDNIGVDGIRRSGSLDLLRKLREQARVEKANSNPDASYTKFDATVASLICKALSHVAATKSSNTSGPADNMEALSALRATLTKLSAAGHTFHDIALTVSAEQASAMREAAKGAKRAA